MTIAFRSKATTTSGASPRTVAAPAGLADGDGLILQVSTSGSDVTPTPPSGFDEVVSARITTIPTVRIYVKEVAASEPATYDVTFPSGSGHTVCLMAVTMDSGNILEADAAATQVNGAGDRIAPSVTTTVADTFLAAFGALGNIGSTPDAAMTERWDADNGSSPRCYCMTQAQAATGATGTRTATGIAAANNMAMVAFREVSAGPPPGGGGALGGGTLESLLFGGKVVR